MGGRQPGLVLDAALDNRKADAGVIETRAPRAVPLPSRLTPAEAEAHKVFVTELAEGGLWPK